MAINEVQKISENNNTLSIIDEPISKENKYKDKTQVVNENIPIKIKKYFTSAEEYYSYNYPEYKLFKIKNILFCKMGNIITFNFDENDNFKPKFSIGPNWYMTLVLNCLILVISILLEWFIISHLNIIFRIIFIILLFISIFLINRAALKYAEIANNKYQDPFHNLYCDKCKIYYNIFDKVSHCSLCKVCIIGFDHHCVWVGKCVGKGNLFAFYQMMIFGGIFYLFLIACVIIYHTKK